MAMKVLIVEDDQATRKTLESGLASKGCEVRGVASLPEVSTALADLLPDILLVDIRTPGLAVRDFLRSVKKDYPDTEVIIVNSPGDLPVVLQSLKMGAVDFITKPVNPGILEIALNRAMYKIDTRKKLSYYTQDLENLVREKTQKLEASEKRYTKLFNEVPSFIIINDRQFKIVESNNRFKEQFGEQPDKHCYQVYRNRREPCPDCPVQRTFKDGMPHSAEMEVAFKDGSIRNLFLQSSAITDPEGRIQFVMGMATDVTVVHQLQDHLASLGLHISTISHGIKGILTGLDGGDYLITSGLEKNDPVQIKEGWEIVKDKISIIRRMVLDILFHSKSRSLDLEPVRIFDFIQELVTIMAPKMKKNGISLVLNTPKPNSDMAVHMDKTVMSAALLAILDNAVDACAAVKSLKERLEIKISVARQKDQTIFKIRDNGKGLAREYREEVFSLFFSDKGNKGTGLGLFIAQRSVNQHRGKIKIDSLPGEYTEFSIYIPT